MTPTALILDFGEVLTKSQPQAVVERMASLARLPLDQFLARYWQHRAAYDGGIAATEFWRRVLDGSGELREAVVSELIEQDARSWRDYREEVWDIAASFRARGNRTAMLSNGVPEVMSSVRAERSLDTWFDVVIVSCEVGMCKPDPGIYRTCLERLEVPAAHALFVDDRIENLRGAEFVGLQTFHFTGEGSAGRLRGALGL
jgi:putative hydrolase of the HAD superfamily